MTVRAVLVFGLGEVASAIAHRLQRDGRSVVLAADTPPKAHRRLMCFADAWWDGSAVLSGLACVRVMPDRLLRAGWPQEMVPFIEIGTDAALGLLPWSVAVDARMAKRGAPLMLRQRAGLSIGCGPGHVAGQTCDLAIETQWGDRLGAVLTDGPTAPLAGEPASIDGVGRERIVYAPVSGPLRVLRDIGEAVARGDRVAQIGDRAILAPIGGTLRGMMRHGSTVSLSEKLCEVDPRPANLAVFSRIGQRPAAIADGVSRALAVGADAKLAPG